MDPARRHEAHPRLTVRLAYELDLHAADAVGEIVIAGAGDRVRQAGEAQLLQTRQELLVVLVAEDAEHPFARVRAAAAVRDGQDQPGDIAMKNGRASCGERVCQYG